MAGWQYAKYSGCPSLWKVAQRAVLTTNITKTETWWGRQPAEALETVQRVAVMMGMPVGLMSKNYDVTNLLRAMTAAISMTNWLAPQLRRKLKHKALQSHLQALHSMILIIYILTPFTMASTLSLFKAFASSKLGWWYCQSVLHGPRPNRKLKAQSHPFVGIYTHSPQPFFADFFSVPVRLSSFHTNYEHATHILYWVCHAPHPGSRIQSLQKVFPTHQRQTCPSRIGSSLLERTRQPAYLGSNPNFHGTSWLPMPRIGFDSRMATPPEQSICMSVLPSTERHPQKTWDEHQRSVWTCHPLATIRTQVHSTGCERHPGIGTVSTPIGTYWNFGLSFTP